MSDFTHSDKNKKYTQKRLLKKKENNNMTKHAFDRFKHSSAFTLERQEGSITTNNDNNK